MAHPPKDALGRIRAIPQSTDAGTVGRGRQELQPPVDYKRFGCPELGVGTSPFEPSSHMLGPQVVEDLFVGYNDV